MCKTKSLFFFFLLLLPLLSWSQKPFKAQHQPGIVVFKIKDAYSSMYDNRKATGENGAEIVARLKAKAGASNVLQPFAKAKNAKNKNQVQKQGSSVLDGIYKMELPAGMSVAAVVEMLLMQPEVLYAEPYYLPELLENPNDPYLTDSLLLIKTDSIHYKAITQVRAQKAWQIQKGSRDIIIGILDTGVDTTHLDLRDNLYKNEADPIDGIDNDGDGFKDNYWGWDFADNDNDPSPSKNGHHGTQVAGVCSATTNNGIGVAGTGYNTRYMPIKVVRSKDGAFTNHFEAIVYAADMGCQVINLSWGINGAQSKYVQDIINYVVYEKDVVMIAAAGNTAAELDYYPASYENVLSVSAVDEKEQLAYWCTWSRFVDILAPGVVYTTSTLNRYFPVGATSYSTPMVAGAAALVRAQFPHLNASQVMELLRQSTNNISDIAYNQAYEFKYGKGSLNMEAALQGPTAPALRMRNLRYSNGIGSYAFQSDTVSIWMDFTNYLNPAHDVTIRLISDNEYATVLEDEIKLGSLNTLQTLSHDRPLRFHLSTDLPPLALLSFRLEFSTPDGYKDYQYFNFRTSGEYIDFKVDDLTLTVASNGNLGYNFDYNLQGLGLRYQGAPLAHNMGLAIAQSPTAVANNIVNTIQPTRRNLDFRTVERLRLYNHTPATMDARSSFEIIVGDSTRLDLRIEQKILGWSQPGDAAAVVLEYNVINRADTTYNDLHIALFSDFNLTEFLFNRAQWDENHQLGYTYNETTGRYAGIALLSQVELLHYALNLRTQEGNTADIGNFISRRNKWEFLNKGVANAGAGLQGKGNDVAQFLGGTIEALAPASSEKVVFALVTASSLEGLQTATQEVRQNYIAYSKAVPPLLTTFSVCPEETFTLTPKAGSQYRFYGSKEDVTPFAEGESISLTGYKKDTAVYVLNMKNEWGGVLERVDIDVYDLSAEFSMSADEIALEEGTQGSISFSANSEHAISWTWDFGNGQQGTEKNTQTYFSEPGIYTINLQVTNANGCKLTSSRILRVLRKKAEPVIDLPEVICPYTSIELKADDHQPINVYADPQRQSLLYSGELYETAPLTSSTTYYVSSGSGIIESDLLEVTATLFEASLDMDYMPVISSQNRYSLQLQAQLEANAAVSQINWYRENTHLGSGESINLAYDARAALTPVITMVVLFENGCELSTKKNLPLFAAPMPAMQNIETCKEETPVLAPGADGLYYFYADASRQELLHRGATYQMAAITENQVVYISNLSGGLESEAIALHISIPEALAQFEMVSDTLTLLHRQASLSLISSSPAAVRWHWDFGNGQSSTEQNPAHTYTQAGSYIITLRAENALGCIETYAQHIVVLPTVENIISYPNPTAGPLSLELPTALMAGGELLLMNAAGHKLMQQTLGGYKKIQLDLQTYPKGIYLILIRQGEQVWSTRIVRY